MALRGPTVGEAVILILADGSNLGREIEREMRKAEPSVKRSAQQTGKEMRAGLRKGLSDFDDDFDKELSRGLDRSKGVLISRARRLGIDFAETVAHAAGGNTQLERILTERLRKAILSGAIKTGQDMDAALTRELLASTFQLEAEQKASAARVAAEQKRLAEQNAKEAQKLQAQIAEDARRFAAMQAKDRAAERERLARERDTLNEEIFRNEMRRIEMLEKLRAKLIRERARAVEHETVKVKVDVDTDRDFGRNLAGKLLGRGSRNDFLHVLGSFAHAVSRVLFGLVDILSFVGKKIFDFIDGFLKISETMGRLAVAFPKTAAAVGKLGAVFAAVLASAIAIGVAIGAVALAFGALAFVVSQVVVFITGLVGVLTALASALSLAVVGGVVALGAAFAAAVIATGAFALAIQGVSDAIKETDPEKFAEQMKKLTPAAQEFVKFARIDLIPIFKDLRKETQESFFKGMVDDLKQAVPQIAPLIKRMFTNAATAAGDVVGILAKGLSSPAVLTALNQIATNIGNVITNLGTGLSGFVQGFIIALGAAQPVLTLFSQAISGIGTSFSNWMAQMSESGKLQDFFLRAYNAAKQVWDILKLIGQIIFEVFSSGAGTGTGFLDTIKEKLTTLLADLRTPEGKSKLADFFRQAEEFARTVWDFLMKIKDEWGKFNSPENQEAFRKIVGLAGDFATALGWAAQATGVIFDNIGKIIGLLPGLSPLGNLTGPIKALDTILQKLGLIESTSNRVTTTVINNVNRMQLSGSFGFGTDRYKPQGAAGRIVNGPTSMLVGEAGPEAIVPLNRSLSRVDPAVRALSAIAQGKTRMAAGGVVSSGTTNNWSEGAIRIVTPTKNPEIVASMVFDRLAAVGVR